MEMERWLILRWKCENEMKKGVIVVIFLRHQDGDAPC
jgi:hypothetical protein